MTPACGAAPASPPSGAAVIGNPDYMVFDHLYRDPLHPRCPRRVQIEIVKQSWDEDGPHMVAHFSGRDLNVEDASFSSCSEAAVGRYGLKQWSFDANMLPDSTFDTGTRRGIWKQDGILWEDGSKWTVIDSRDFLPAQPTQEEQENARLLGSP